MIRGPDRVLEHVSVRVEQLFYMTGRKGLVRQHDGQIHITRRQPRFREHTLVKRPMVKKDELWKSRLAQGGEVEILELVRRS